jgi:hypothetical protein
MLNAEQSELLSAFLDKQLSGEELSFVHEKLTSSAEWREELEILKKSKSLMTALPHLSAPADLIEALVEQAEQASVKKRPFMLGIFNFSNPWVMGGSFATAAAATLLVVQLNTSRTIETLPLEPFLQAHAQSQSSSFIHEEVLSASEYSSRLKHNENA